MNSEEIDVEEIEKQLVVLARSGLVLPKCPSCGSILHIENEALAGKCEMCGVTGFPLSDILWISVDNLAKA